MSEGGSQGGREGERGATCIYVVNIMHASP